MKDKATIAKGEIRSALNKSTLNKSSALNNSRYAQAELTHNLNNTLSTKQTPFRAEISKSHKKKAQKLVPKISEKSKTIQKSKDYDARKKKSNKKLTLKKRDLKPHVNPMLAARPMDKK